MTPPNDPALSATAREAIIAAITTDAPDSEVPPHSASASLVGAAVTLSALLPQTHDLTDPEYGTAGPWADALTGK